MKKIRGALALTALSLCSAANAESLADYIAACKQALDVDKIPGYSCYNGVSVPTGTDLILTTNNNYIGKVMLDNPSVDAIFLCRSVTSSGNAGLNGYILQNRDNGNTCFFDAKPGKSASSVPEVKADSNGESTFWASTSAIIGQCHACHTADPFIVSKGLAPAFKQLHLLHNGRNLLDDYNIVGSDDPNSHFFGWQQEKDNAIVSNTCADSCHRLTTGVVAVTSRGNSTVTSEYANQFLEDQMYDNFLMPPAAGSLFDVDDQFMTTSSYRIQNYWNFNAILNLDDNGDVRATDDNWSTLKAEWRLERVDSSSGTYYRIKNLSKIDEYLHMEGGPLKSGEIKTGWWSSHWELLPYTDQPVDPEVEGQIFRIKNRWTGAYLHVQNGPLEAGAINMGWWSARWNLDPQD